MSPRPKSSDVVPADAPLTRQSLRDQITERLREWILDGTYQPGDRLVELTIARRLGVSRAPLREALWQVAKDGLVRFEPNRGAFVSELSAADVRDIFDVREALETRAALRIRESETLGAATAELKEAYRALQKAAAKRDMRSFTAADLEFHATISRLSGNKVIEEVLSGVSVRFFGYGLIRDLPRSGVYKFDTVVSEHGRLVELIAGGTPGQIIAGFAHAFKAFREYSLERFAARSPETRRT